MSVRCTVTTGFFVLESCPNPAAHQCPRCRRPICAAHTHYPPGGQFAGPCPECYASDLRHLGDPRDDPSWTETFRRLFYSSATAGPTGVSGFSGAAASPLFWALFSARDRRNLRRARRRGRRRRDGDDGDDGDDGGDDDADFDFDDFFDS